MSKKLNKRQRQERAKERETNRPPETLESLKKTLAQLPKSGDSAKEIAKLKNKIAELQKKQK